MRDDTIRLKHNDEDRWLQMQDADAHWPISGSKGCDHMLTGGLTGQSVTATDVTSCSLVGSLANQ